MSGITMKSHWHKVIGDEEASSNCNCHPKSATLSLRRAQTHWAKRRQRRGRCDPQLHHVGTALLIIMSNRLFSSRSAPHGTPGSIPAHRTVVIPASSSSAVVDQPVPSRPAPGAQTFSTVTSYNSVRSALVAHGRGCFHLGRMPVTGCNICSI